MARLLILLAILGAVVWFLHWFRKTPPHQVAQVLRKALLWGVIGVLVLAAATGRLNPIFAAIGAAVPLVMRAAALVRLVPALQQMLRALGLGGVLGSGSGPTGASAGRVSSLRTRFLEMRLDHASGAMSGRVLDGPFQGREIVDLSLEELMRMLEFYRDADAQSVAVLEAYLDRERGADWRSRDQGAGATASTVPGNRLTKAEAWSILGLEPGTDAETIRAAHRRLMQRLHPDRGGSDYLAAQINAAKRLLLDE
jgi:hypothetical protein